MPEPNQTPETAQATVEVTAEVQESVNNISVASERFASLVNMLLKMRRFVPAKKWDGYIAYLSDNGSEESQTGLKKLHENNITFEQNGMRYSIHCSLSGQYFVKSEYIRSADDLLGEIDGLF